MTSIQYGILFYMQKKLEKLKVAHSGKMVILMKIQ